MIKRRKVAAANRAAPSPDSTDDYSPTKFNQLSPDKQQTYLISLLENSTSYTRSAVYRHLQAELRCDIISRLPGELRTLILQHLPAKTLSQLPSVSSQWRRSIDADAQLWRSLIVAEGWSDRMHKDLRNIPKVHNNSEEIGGDEYKMADYSSRHPYKRLFIRYFNIRQNWLSGSNVCRTAFPAHGSAVVTSLLLSGDRIISASDDAVISVHTVQNGTVRRRHLLGHEGGVWCLQLCDGPNRLPLAYTEQQLQDTNIQKIVERGENTLISGSTDRSFRVWDLQRGRCLAVIAGHSSTIRSLIAVSRPVDWASYLALDSPLKLNELADDEVLMITGSRDSTLKVWAVPLAPPPDAADAEDEGELSDGGEDAYEINGGGDYPHDDGTDDELMRLPTGGSGEMEQNNWQTDDLNPEDQQEQRAAPPAANDDYGQPPGRFGERLSSPSSPPAETPISPNSSQLVKSKPRCLMTLSGHTQSVRCLAADYPFIVSGSYDCKVRIWRLDEGRCTAVLMGHTDKVYTVALDRLGGLCFSGSLDYTVRVWNIQTGTCLHTLEGHTDLVGLLQHRYLPYSMSWPRIPGSPVRTFPVPAAVNGGKQPGRKRKRSIATIYNSNHQQQPQLRFPVLISAAADRSIMMWDVRQLSDSTPPLQTMFGHQAAITSFDFDADRAVSGSEGAVKLWDMRQGGRFVRNLVSGIRGTWRVAFSDSRCVVSVQRNEGTWIEVYDFDGFK